MKRSHGFFLLAVVGALAAACGGAPQVTVTQPQPMVVTQTACAEQWVHMPMSIHFPTSGSTIDEQNRQILQELVRSAQSRQDLRAVRVEGHTDTCGNELNNMALSQQRAQSVAGELVTMGVPANSVQTIGYGSTQPRATENCNNAQTLSEQDNRRVEFSLLVCR